MQTQWRVLLSIPALDPVHVSKEKHKSKTSGIKNWNVAGHWLNRGSVWQFNCPAMKRLTVFIPERRCLHHWSSSEWDLELLVFSAKCRQPCLPHEPWWWAAISGEGKLHRFKGLQCFLNVASRKDEYFHLIAPFIQERNSSVALPMDVVYSLIMFFWVSLWCGRSRGWPRLLASWLQPDWQEQHQRWVATPASSTWPRPSNASAAPGLIIESWYCNDATVSWEAPRTLHARAWVWTWKCRIIRLAVVCERRSCLNWR